MIKNQVKTLKNEAYKVKYENFGVVWEIITCKMNMESAFYTNQKINKR